MKIKLIPLWTAHLSAENAPAFKAHIGPQPTRAVTSFKLRLDQRNRPLPPAPKEQPQPQIVKIVQMETRVSKTELPAINAAHDAAHPAPLLTEAFYRSADAPSRSTRTATERNRASK